MKHDYFKWIALAVFVIAVGFYFYETRYFISNAGCSKYMLGGKTGTGASVLDRWTGKTDCR